VSDRLKAAVTRLVDPRLLPNNRYAITVPRQRWILPLHRLRWDQQWNDRLTARDRQLLGPRHLLPTKTQSRLSAESSLRLLSFETIRLPAACRALACRVSHGTDLIPLCAADQPER